MDVERLEGEVISLCGAGEVCEAMKTGLLLAGLRINFNQRALLAGFVTPCVTVWDRSGSIAQCFAIGSFVVFLESVANFFLPKHQVFGNFVWSLGPTLTHALASSASQFVHKKKFLRMYTSTNSGGLEPMKLNYTRLEDNLIRQRGDRQRL